MSVRATASLNLLLVAALLGCGGKLEDPKRFASVVKKFSAAAGHTAGSAGRAGSASVENDEDAGSLGGGDAGTGTAAPACAQQLFKTSCGLAGCHAAGAAQVDLASAGVAARLIDKTSTGPKCSGKVFISTSGKSNLLLDKLSDPPPCGDKMPIGGTISASDRTCLTAWVRSVGGRVADGGM